LRVPAERAGQRVRCPKCKAGLRLPAAPAADPPPDTSDPLEFDDRLLDQLGAGEAVESPEERRARHEAQEQARRSVRVTETTAPAQTRAPGVGWGPWLQTCGAIMAERSFVGWGIALGLIFGVVLVFVGIKELRLREQSSDVPHEITCAELAATGPGDNRHVVMREFVFLPDYVYSTRFGAWDGAVVPCVSFEALNQEIADVLGISELEVAALSEPRWEEAAEQIDLADFEFRVCVSLPAADGEAYVDEMGAQDAIQGTIMSALQSEEREILSESYPLVDLAECWILVAGRKPGTAESAWGLVVGGVALLVVTCVILARRASYLCSL
jgi:hypothetical protein